MPRMGQIIPEYLTPHVKTYINDNSTFTDDVSTPSVDGVKMLCVFASAKGEDRVVKTIDNLTDYLEEYGTPNYTLYNQPCYMPYAALSSGNARVYCMRVTSDTATYANTVVCAYVKTDADTGLTVKFGTAHMASCYEKDTMPTALSTGNGIVDENGTSITFGEANTEGYTPIALFAVISKGRGEYGNSFRFRIVSDTLANTDNDYVNYLFEILDNSGTVVAKKEQHSGGFDVNAIIGNTSIYIEDVVNDPDNGSAKVELAINYEGFEKLYSMYKSINSDAPDFSKCDMLFGVNKQGDTLEKYIIEESSTDNAFAFDNSVGISLVSGGDGTFAPNYTPQVVDGEVTGSTREEAIDAAYIKAFKGEYDHKVRSKRCTPCDLILDANYSKPVKIALAELATYRGDSRCVIDAGFLHNTSQATAWVQDAEIKTISNFVISKECQHYKIRDPFTGRIIPVTMTYYLAEHLPTHIKTIGNHVPFVGETYAQLTNYIRNSIKPSIDADALAVKEILYTNKCNFFECISEDNYVRATQGTSQAVWSDLSEENNVSVILEMKRMLEEFVGARLYNFAEPEDRRRFTEDATRMFSDYRGNRVRSYEVYFDMNPFEEERSILHCYLAVVFRTMAKRGIIEIDINKRV